MDETTAFAAAQRQYSQAFNNFTAAATSNGNFVSHLDPNLNTLENGIAFTNQFTPQLDSSHGQTITMANSFPESTERTPAQYPRLRSQAMSTAQEQQRQAQQGQPGGQQFNIVAPSIQIPNEAFAQRSAVQSTPNGRKSASIDEHGSSGAGKKEAGHFSGMKKILNPPDLVGWRQRLFDVEDTVIMSEEEYVTRRWHPARFLCRPF